MACRVKIVDRHIVHPQWAVDPAPTAKTAPVRWPEASVRAEALASWRQARSRAHCPALAVHPHPLGTPCAASSAKGWQCLLFGVASSLICDMAFKMKARGRESLGLLLVHSTSIGDLLYGVATRRFGVAAFSKICHPHSGVPIHCLYCGFDCIPHPLGLPIPLVQPHPKAMSTGRPRFMWNNAGDFRSRASIEACRLHTSDLHCTLCTQYCTASVLRQGHLHLGSRQLDTTAPFCTQR